MDWDLCENVLEKDILKIICIFVDWAWPAHGKLYIKLCFFFFILLLFSFLTSYVSCYLSPRSTAMWRRKKQPFSSDQLDTSLFSVDAGFLKFVFPAIWDFQLNIKEFYIEMSALLLSGAIRLMLVASNGGLCHKKKTLKQSLEVLVQNCRNKHQTANMS